MSRSTVHYADSKTNATLKKLHNKLRPAGTPIQRVEYIIELILLRMFETKLKREDGFKELREVFKQEKYKDLLFNYLKTIGSDLITEKLNKEFFPFYGDIINKVREVVKGNLSTEVSDQLSLIQQVFKGSNFTNNVQSGNLSEIINAVDELDEERLLHSDLLGDAIESALSETGGTKDMGLFRTPDHIRHFMVGLTEPSIKDTIHDPACGTGGFLFDAYDYVLAQINAKFADDEDEIKFRFPKFDKSHPEMKAWFEDFFKKNPAEVPSEEETKLFYNQGISGIEYLGIVKKMAAVNFYIRGANPNNIEHGDSLHLFRPERKETKSLVLANPPFGAERDQASYPNVWEDYSKESETTILFVKMMLELLRPGGRCAVIVSEGFLTWEQNSARALRQMLLDEAILEAVIGLPQGVFISKSGQGPKTSILLFKKPLTDSGDKTKQVWFYQVQNDGYTKGSNRNVQAGCQLVDALNIYHNFVKVGKTAPEVKNSFTLSVDWLKTIDPRIKVKIRQETRETLEPQREDAKQKLEQKLKEKFEKQLKKSIPTLFADDLPSAAQENIKEELQKLNSVWDNRIQNEIAKRIERAYIYSLNASTYRSSLTDAQIEQFKTALEQSDYSLTSDLRDSESLDQWYAQLIKLKAQNNYHELAQTLLKFDPQNAIEADIVREVVADITANLAVFDAINALFKAGAKYPMVKLGSILTRRNETIKLEDDKFYQQITARLWGKGIVPRGEKVLGAEIMTKTQHVVRAGNFVISKIDARSGACGLISKELDGAISSAEFPSFEVNTDEASAKYIELILSDTRFFAQLEAMVEGATGRRRLDIDDFLELKIPLPPLEKQLEIVAKIEKLQAVVKGAEMVIDNWEVDFEIDANWQIFPLASVCESVSTGSTPVSEKMSNDKGEIPFIKVFNLTNTGRLNFDKKTFISKETHLKQRRSICYPNDVLMNIVGPPLGKISIVPNTYQEWNTNQAVVIFRVNSKIVLNKYLTFYLLRKETLARLTENVKMTTGQWNLSKSYCEKFTINVPDLEIQEQIIQEIESKSLVLENLELLKTETEAKIKAIVNSLWAVE
ncbi:N-6 DNA methylase [Emticicia oligotrophica]|uniref:N-6 DNA methylase n=1 Tax=Emticicia oligotrophica TaxID=312279 RepID=UPI00273C3966|nr:N-6 DNA methylase [Emticicia oligotrophica]